MQSTAAPSASPASFASPEPGPWPRRFALAAVAAAVPLVALGGSVTTLGAGLAVDGWLAPEGHFLWLFPLDKWLRDLPTFVEHSHRLAGSLVGLAALAACAAACARRHPARSWAITAFAAVCLQGTLGGLRVLERSRELAFLHGALAQAVFALLSASALMLGPAHAARPATAGGLPDRSLPRIAWIAAAVLLAQATLGSWYRHALRAGDPASAELAAGRLPLHILGAFASFAAVAALAARLTGAAQASPRFAGRAGSAGLAEFERRAAHLLRDRNWLLALLALQLALGLAAWASHSGDARDAGQWITSVAHVLVGALLLAATVRAALRTGMLARAEMLTGAAAPARAAGAAQALAREVTA